MTDEALTIRHLGGSAVRLAEFLRELGPEQLGNPCGIPGAGDAAADEPAWRQATRAIEFCRRAAELAARR
jgi:hypothetical protein